MGTLAMGDLAPAGCPGQFTRGESFAPGCFYHLGLQLLFMFRNDGRLPFPKKTLSWWSPLLKRILGRPSFLEPEIATRYKINIIHNHLHSDLCFLRWVRLHPQQMIALVLTAALLACVGFSSVLLFRHMPIRRMPTPSR